MKLFKKPFRFAVLYGIILTLFTAYTLLDAFVIPRAYAVVPPQTLPVSTPVPTQEPEAVITDNEVAAEPKVTPAPEPESTQPVITDSSYSDGNITITMTQYAENETTIYVADVVLSLPQYLKTVFADNTYGKNVTAKTSETAEAAGAILAINGDYYGARNSGYVIRGGVVYRDRSAGSSQEDLAIYADGSFELISEGDITASELLSAGVYDLLSFGPGLIDGGEIIVDEWDEVDKARTSNPRTAIGIIDDLHYVFVVSDGRTDESAGLSLMQLAEFMQGLGVQTAYNLDGGGSSTMYFMGEVINNPTSGRGKTNERSVSDIVCIAY